jgi:rhodanese-related sulfurtransferase
MNFPCPNATGLPIIQAMRKLVLLLSLLMPVASAHAQKDADPVIDAMETYLDSAEFGGGVVLSKQIAGGEWKSYQVIDTRLAEDYAAGHIDGAIHIEWRNVLARRHEIPRDKPVLLYCNTGAQSAQAYLTLRLAGWDNTLLLQGGLEAWRREFGTANIVK